jgi:hypothetical protein
MLGFAVIDPVTDAVLGPGRGVTLISGKCRTAASAAYRADGCFTICGTS